MLLHLAPMTRLQHHLAPMTRLLLHLAKTLLHQSPGLCSVLGLQLARMQIADKIWMNCMAHTNSGFSQHLVV